MCDLKKTVAASPNGCRLLQSHICTMMGIASICSHSGENGNNMLIKQNGGVVGIASVCIMYSQAYAMYRPRLPKHGLVKYTSVQRVRDSCATFVRPKCNKVRYLSSVHTFVRIR